MKIFQNLSALERVQALEDNALDVVHGFTYQRELTDEELADIRIEFATSHLDLKQLDAQKAELLAEINGKIKNLKLQAASQLQMIETGREPLTGTVYFLQDFDANKIRIYDADGYMVAERPMRGNERQGNIFGSGETATGTK